MEKGFQLSIKDIEDGGFFSAKMRNGFFSKEQLSNMINRINSYGYMSFEMGTYLKSLIDSGDIIYLKQFNSTDLDSILTNGIYLNGNVTSGFNNVPRNISEINIENTVYKIESLYRLVTYAKFSNGLSEGGNPIDSFMILRIPKDKSVDEIAYKVNGIYAIKPEYIDGYASVDKDGNVTDYVTRKLYENSNKIK